MVQGTRQGTPHANERRSEGVCRCTKPSLIQFTSRNHGIVIQEDRRGKSISIRSADRSNVPWPLGLTLEQVQKLSIKPDPGRKWFWKNPNPVI
jgi:folate-dependent tRNA-U54 methylase TrmFO/GidA